jgi:peptidoglycan/xylan/chitin deacetylase (PgdA/CDA1 family)
MLASMPSASASLSLRSHAATALSKLPLRTTLKLLGKWQGVLGLNYHRIGDAGGQLWDRGVWSASAEELDGQLLTLARCAEVINPCDVPAAMSAGRGRRVLITFDDGYRDNYELAFPLLRRHGLSATFFLTTGFLDDRCASWWDEIAWMVNRAGVQASCAEGRSSNSEPTMNDNLPSVASLLPAGVSWTVSERAATIDALIARYKMLSDGEGERFLEQLAAAIGCERCDVSDAEGVWMTWEMAREMHAAGMTIGGHTVSHPLLARLPVERQREEIAVCARRLREEIGVEMRWFAYPVGSRDTFTRATQDVLRDCGVELAFSYYGGFARPSRWNPLDVPRVHVDRKLAPRLLYTALAGGRR